MLRCTCSKTYPGFFVGAPCLATPRSVSMCVTLFYAGLLSSRTAAADAVNDEQRLQHDDRQQQQEAGARRYVEQADNRQRQDEQRKNDVIPINPKSFHKTIMP